MLVAKKTLKPFKGDLDDYRDYLIEQNREANREANRKESGTTEALTAPKKETSQQSREERKQLNNELRRITREKESAEKKIPKLEDQIGEIDAILGDPDTYNTHSPQAIEKLNADKETLETELMTLEELWLNHSGRIEEINELI